MKKISITTAFISLLAFYGFEAFSIETSNENSQIHTIATLNNLTASERSNYKEEEISNNLKYKADNAANEAKIKGERAYNNMKDAANNATDAVKEGGKYVYNETKVKGRQAYNNMKNTVNNATEAVKEGGEYAYNATKRTVRKSVDTVKDEGRKLQIENARRFEKKYPSSVSYYKKLNNKPEITLKGNVVSHIWYKNEEDHLKENDSNMGKEVDAVLQIKAEHTNSTLGVAYGADLQADLALVNGYLESGNKKATVFLNNAYTKINLGYQNGVDVQMRVDGTTLQAGHSVLPVNLKGVTDKDKPQHSQFYTSPVLWSESIDNLSNVYVMNLSDDSNDLSSSLTGLISKTDKKRISNSLPMRISIQSPNFLGAKFGISYSPTGYDENLWHSVDSKKVNEYTKKVEDKQQELTDPNSEYSKAATLVKTRQKELEKAQSELDANPDDEQKKNAVTIAKNALETDQKNYDTQDANFKKDLEVLKNNLIKASNGSLNGPSYNNLISGALVYDYDYYDDIKVKFSLTGEYGKAATSEELAKKYTSYYEMYNLMSGAIGINVDYMGIKFGGSYGYLGKSGLVKAVHEIENTNTLYASQESARTIPDKGSNGQDDEENADKRSPQLSGQPSGQLSGESSGQPSGESSGQPSGESSGQPSGESSGQPSGESSGQPSGESSGQPSGESNKPASQYIAEKVLSSSIVSNKKDDENLTTYYMTAAVGYQYQNTYLSVNYEQSSFQGNKYRNIGVGAEYNFNFDTNNTGDYKLFINYNLFKTEQKNLPTGATDNKGYVLSGGIKFDF